MKLSSKPRVKWWIVWSWGDARSRESLGGRRVLLSNKRLHRLVLSYILLLGFVLTLVYMVYNY